MEKVRNPETNRMILVGGKTYQKLYLKKTKGLSLKKSLELIPKSRTQKISLLRKEIKQQKNPKGSKTRGWRAVSPQKGFERHELHSKCGDECFLNPENEGYPVCASLRYKQGCKVDCRGINAAYVRSKQYKDEKISKKAEELKKKYKC